MPCGTGMIAPPTIYFLDATLASAFVARWCEAAEGVLRARTDAPAKRSGQVCTGRREPADPAPVQFVEGRYDIIGTERPRGSYIWSAPRLPNLASIELVIRRLARPGKAARS